ncbi:hypothetical protein EC973_001122 [Apophysomyces ossiformis]|uniref:Uncharacterized protein n=1 Tax=Apophysomyces ossiformis TaxID=679940 RepID=A0A8H7BQT0_9FUNG|nr:hypothetical protein EC973_001122 [Apophysomyces ossiformis]
MTLESDRGLRQHLTSSAYISNGTSVRQGNPFSRLDLKRQRLLTSVLAHIRTGYVANRTPPYDTPPLLVLYSCNNTESRCGPLHDRLLSVTSAYFFSMLWDGAAFAFDMRVPVKFEWYFEPIPGYMSMTTDHADLYLGRADAATIRRVDHMEFTALATEDYRTQLKADNIRILQTSRWDNWMAMRNNPSMSRSRDKYQLNHLSSKSEWFWVASRLLFAKPSSWLAKHLTPYRNLMGGYVVWSESLSFMDPANMITPAISDWFRIGIHMIQKDSAECLASRIASLCSTAEDLGKECHIFLSSTSRESLDRLRKAISLPELKDHHRIQVHTVAEHYDFSELNTAPKSSNSAWTLMSAEDRLKSTYARIFMDWMILSRMDYLVGQEGDDFLKTAAWAAQVRTDLLHLSSNCQFQAMEDW